MSFEIDKDGRRRRKAESDSEPNQKPAGAENRRKKSPEVGSALRSAYQGMVDEQIPPEMLDLLGKLG